MLEGREDFLLVEYEATGKEWKRSNLDVIAARHLVVIFPGISASNCVTNLPVFDATF